MNVTIGGKKKLEQYRTKSLEKLEGGLMKELNTTLKEEGCTDNKKQEQSGLLVDK